MKKLFLGIGLLFSLTCWAQLPLPIKQTLGSRQTLVVSTNGLAADSIFILPAYADTSRANLGPYAKYYPGDLIRTGDSVWMRSADASRWNLLTGRVGVDTIYRTAGKDSIQFKIAGRYHAIKDSTGGSDRVAVDTIYRTSGKDSIQFKINGRYYAIKDSTGSGDRVAVDTIYRTAGKDSIQFKINGRYYAIKDSTGSGETYLGTVTSVGLALPVEFSVTGSPVTSAGTLTGAWVAQSPYTALARASGSGVPSFQSIDTTFINSFSLKVRSLFSGTYPIIYANGNISLDTTVGKWRSENYYNTIYTPLTRSINNGYGILGGGNLTVDRTLRVDTATTFPALINTLSLTTIGTSGAATWNPAARVLNIPVYTENGTDELQSLSVSGTTTGITTLSQGGGSMTLAGGGINTISVSGSTITVTGTEVGTVSSVSVGNLSPIFTSSVSNSTSAASISFSLSNTTQYTVLGRSASGTGVPSYISIDTTFIANYSTKVRPLVSLTTTGTSGAATYNSTTGVFNIPQYSFSETYLGTVTSVGLSLPAEFTVTNSPVTSSGTLTGAWVSQSAYKVFGRASTSGVPSFISIDTTFIANYSTKVRPLISLTTTGSGAATYNNVTGVLNIPQYQAAGTYVTQVTADGLLTSSGGTTPNISSTLAQGKLAGRGGASGTGILEAISVGGILSFSGTTLLATEVDGSTSNELQTLSVSGTTTGITTLSNAGGSMTIAGAGINTVGVSGSTITITGTEVDGSTGNEIQTLSASGTTSPAIDLSLGGGSVTFTGAGITSLSRVGNTITISSTEVDGSTSNEIQTLSASGTTTPLITLSQGGGSFSITGAGIAVASRSGTDITITATEVDGSTSNELQTLSVSGTTTGITTLSNAGGSMTIAGAGINTVGVSGSTITITGTENYLGTLTSVSAGGGMSFSTITTSGAVTLGTPSSITLSSTNAVSTGTHEHLFAPGGNSSQVILGNATLGPYYTGTVTSFSSGNLSPLFTTSVATSTTTPALTFSLNNAGPGTVFANKYSISYAPEFTSVIALGSTGVTAGGITFRSATGGSGEVTLQLQGGSGNYNFNLPLTAGTTGQVLTSQGGASAMTWTTLNTGTVTSVGLSINALFGVTGSPVTTAGTLTASLSNQSNGTVFTVPIGSAQPPTFSYTLYLGEGTSGGQIDLHGANAGTVSIKASAGSGNYYFNLPTTAGTAGQVLTSQGGGTNDMTWTSIASSITADNGLTMSTASNVQLGGTLLKNTSINTDNYYLKVYTAQASTMPMWVTATTGRAFLVENTAAGQYTGTFANYDAYGALSVFSAGGDALIVNTSGSGIAITGSTTNGPASYFSIGPTTTNTVANVLKLERISSGGNGAASLGGSIDYYLESSSGTSLLSNQLASKWTDAGAGSQKSQFVISGVYSATTADLFTLSGNGALKLNKYGVGSFSGTTAYYLAVDGSGNVIETSASASSTNDGYSYLTFSLSGGGSLKLIAGNSISFSIGGTSANPEITINLAN